MEYGSVYRRASRNADEDAASILEAQSALGVAPQYQPYQPVYHRGSSEATDVNRNSLSVSPVALQQSLPPPAPPLEDRSTEMGPSIYESRAILDAPYQEPVAYENSTQFRSNSSEAPKPEGQETVIAAPDGNPPRETRRYFRHPRHIPEPWKAGVWARFPWWGIGALFAIVLLTGASAGILLASDGMSLDSWRVGEDNATPNVYLAVFEMVMNFLILFALADGVVIRFWRQLLHGSTLSSIHDTYDSARLWPAVKRIARLRFNTVAVACVFAALSFTRGPLLQRASTVKEDGITDTSGEVQLRIAPFPIPEYFETEEIDPRKQSGVTPEFSAAVRATSSGNALRYEQPAECGDSCIGTVKGFAFEPECSQSMRAFDLSSLPDDCRSCKTAACEVECKVLLETDLNVEFFSVGFRQEKDVLTVSTAFKEQGSCSGVVRLNTCAFSQVTADYPIIMVNGTIDRCAGERNARIYDEPVPYDPLLMEKYWPLAFESLFPPVSVNVTPASDFSQLQYTKCVNEIVNETTIITNSSSTTSCSNGTTSQPNLLARDPSVLYATPSRGPSDTDALCDLTWRDPMPDIIDKMQSLGFRITIDMAASNGSVFTPTYTGAALEALRLPWNQTINITGYRTQALYRTNPILVGLGVLVSIVGVAAIVPLYSGFWELGRRVSLNPLEVARAFGAPLMEGLDGNATPEMVAVDRGGMAVRYGALERYGEGKMLRVEESARANVRTPWQGEVFA